jgi:NhaP-type Na+/H+ or K+/H+ antiporter
MKITTVSIPLSLAICIIFVITGLWLKNYKEVNQTNAWCHESSIAAIFGLLVGGLIQFSFNSSVLFDSDLFFYLVIPPIIFSAGYSLKRKRFFRYGVAIAIFGIVGTIINILLTGFAAHLYSHLVSSTDTNLFLTWPKSFLLGKIFSKV